MRRIPRTFLLAAALVAATLAAGAAGGSSGSHPRSVAGTWRLLPASPVPARQALAGVWTGKRFLVYGRNPAVNPSVDVAGAYDPAADEWTRLSPPRGPGYVPGYGAVWTGRQMLVFGAFHSVAYDPASGRWRELRKTLPGGIVVWTGREAVGWGGGCCGDASAGGAAYDPAKDAYRTLPRSPLAPSQRPVGAWTGRELLLLVGSVGPDGKRWPARLARAAAYEPAANRWRRIAPPPAAVSAAPGTAAWDGRELLVVAAGTDARSAFAYDPAANRWRRLASLPAARRGPAAVWAGRRLLVWGGENAKGTKPLNDGLSLDPGTGRWSRIPSSPLRARGGSLVVWTGRALLVWGGLRGVCNPGCHTDFLVDGAAFRPAAR